MYTYKQDIKEKAREEIWKHAIRTLTVNRSSNLVINENYIRDAWEHVLYKCEYTKDFFKARNPNIEILNNWVHHSKCVYGNKNPEDLKIVYLCGPEPENDLNDILKQGVRIENVWAVEAEKELYKKAIQNVRNIYPSLKIFHGKINDFFDLYNQVFDIIYLDFVSPIFSNSGTPFSVIHKIIDGNILSDIGVLITNYPVPDYSDEMNKLMKDFFIDCRYLEGSVHGIKYEDGENIYKFADGVRCYGYSENHFENLIKNNFKESYSSLCSLYPIYYANVVAPRYRVANKNATFNMLYKSEQIANSYININTKSDWDDYDSYRELGFVERLKMETTNSKLWNSAYNQKESGKNYNRYDAVKMATILCNFECFQNANIFSEDMLNSLRRIFRSIKEYEDNRLFCDILMPSDIIEVAINQLGIPFHPNFRNQKRFEYTAKTRTMFVDIITFDKCRSFYDWMPLMELYGETMVSMERQILFRSCLDAIGKQLTFTPIPIYDGGVSMIGIGETEWANFVETLPFRYVID